MQVSIQCCHQELYAQGSLPLMAQMVGVILFLEVACQRSQMDAEIDTQVFKKKQDDILPAARKENQDNLEHIQL